MPVLCGRLFQPQLVPFMDVIKRLAPAQTNIIILCSVSISLGVIIIFTLKRKRQQGRLFEKLATSEGPWEDDERGPFMEPSSSPPPANSMTSKVDFKPDTGHRHHQHDHTITTMSEASQKENSELQQRRSYASKVASEVDELNGEIIVAEGWRRHTKVFGGGICQACLESEERMKAMNAALQNRQPQETRPGGGGGGLPAESSSQEQSR